MKILLDMDGVLVNFVKGVCALHNMQCPTDVVSYDIWKHRAFQNNGITYEDTVEAIRNVGAKVFWEMLTPYDETTELMSVLYGTGLGIQIITTPMRQVPSYYGKKAWLRKYHPELSHKVIFTDNKYWYANDATILIDDKDDNVIAFRKSGGHAILYPQSWNYNSGIVSGIKKVMYVQQQIKEILDGQSNKVQGQNI